MEFRIAFGWRIFMYIGAPLIGTLGLWMIYQFIVKLESIGFWMNLFSLVISLSLVSGAIYCLIRTHREKIIINKNEFIHRLAFKDKGLLFNEVEGFRINEHYFLVFPNNDKKKVLRISAYIETPEQLQNFLFENFQNLDVIDLENEEIEILNNKAFGKNADEIDVRFAQARKSANWLNSVAAISCLWAWFYPHPYNLVILVNLILPAFAVGLFIGFSGMIKLDKKDNSLYPTILHSLVFPSCAIGIRVLFDYNFLTKPGFWILSMLFASIIFAIIFAFSEELKRRNISGIVVSIIVFGILYGYTLSSVSILNVLLDEGNSTAYLARVSGKSSSKNFDKIKLEKGWIPQVDKEVNAIVSLSFFKRVQEGDSVKVIVKDGAFGIPWYKVKEVIYSDGKEHLPEFEFDEDSTLFNLDKL